MKKYYKYKNNGWMYDVIIFLFALWVLMSFILIVEQCQ